jgi:ribosomal protein S27AE
MDFKSKMVPGNKANPEDILNFIGEKGYELTEEQLEQVSGGGEWKNECCPRCGHTGTMYNPGTKVSRCGKCGLTW